MLDFNIQESKKDNISFIEVSGEIDVYTSPKLNRQLATIIDDTPSKIIADLQQVRYIDSMGLGVFAHTAQRLIKQNGEFFIISNNQQLIKLFDVAGLSNAYITIVGNKEDIPI